MDGTRDFNKVENTLSVPLFHKQRLAHNQFLHFDHVIRAAIY